MKKYVLACMLSFSCLLCTIEANNDRVQSNNDNLEVRIDIPELPRTYEQQSLKTLIKLLGRYHKTACLTASIILIQHICLLHRI